MMNRNFAGAVVLTLSLTLAGCASFASYDPPTHATAPADQQAPRLTAQFGGALTYLDGISVSVSAPAVFVPGEFASTPDPGTEPVVFTIVLTNGSKEPYDPSLVYETVTSGGVESSSMWDDSLGASPATTVLPGRSVTYKVAYSVKDPTDVVMEITPEMFADSAIFSE